MAVVKDGNAPQKHVWRARIARRMSPRMLEVLMGTNRLTYIFGGAALGVYALMLSLEFLTGGDKFSPGEFAVDALSLLLTIVSAACGALAFAHYRGQRLIFEELTGGLKATRLKEAAWRAAVDAHIDGLRDTIERQFSAWGLSQAEREVAYLILKGFSHREIASLRGAAEKTVRQQAQSIYNKSGFVGKSGLAAFFLEDLLSPIAARSVNPAAQASAQEAPRLRG
jgi:DNA-binding CsgD family transcriptional regulator